MKTNRGITAIIAILGILFINVTPALAVPPLPSSFYGTVKLDGENVPGGIQVTAWINDVQYTYSNIQIYEGDTVYSLDVSGDDSSTTGVIEGGTQGDTVIIKIGDRIADETGTWQTGTNQSLNLNLYTPTDIILSNNSVEENQASGTLVGILTTVDTSVGDTHTYSLVTGEGDANNASFTITDNRVLTAAIFDFEVKNSYSIRVRSTDHSGLYIEKTFHISILEENEVPVIVEGESTFVIIDEDGIPTPFSLTLHATDEDTGDTLTWSVTTPASHGTASADGTGLSQVVDYTPEEDYSGSDGFVVQVSDGHGGTDAITVYVTINPVNDAPTIAEGTSIEINMSENGAPFAFDLTLHASDPDGDNITWSIDTPADHGTASVNGTGETKLIEYQPEYNYYGSDSFVVRISDGHGGLYTITVNVTLDQSFSLYLPTVQK